MKCTQELERSEDNSEIGLSEVDEEIALAGLHTNVDHSRFGEEDAKSPIWMTAKTISQRAVWITKHSNTRIQNQDEGACVYRC